MSDLVGNLEDRVYHDAAHSILNRPGALRKRGSLFYKRGGFVVKCAVFSSLKRAFFLFGKSRMLSLDSFGTFMEIHCIDMYKLQHGSGCDKNLCRGLNVWN